MADRDLQIRGGGGHPDPELRGGGSVSKKRFEAIPASVWSKHKGEPGPPWPLPWIRHWILLGRGRRGKNSCEDHLDIQQRGKARSWCRSGLAEYRISLKIEGKADRTAMDG